MVGFTVIWSYSMWDSKKLVVQAKNTKSISSCGSFQNGSICRIDVAQIWHTGMNKLGDCKGVSWIGKIWLNLCWIWSTVQIHMSTIIKTVGQMVRDKLCKYSHIHFLPCVTRDVGVSWCLSKMVILLAMFRSCQNSWRKWISLRNKHERDWDRTLKSDPITLYSQMLTCRLSRTQNLFCAGPNLLLSVYFYTNSPGA